MIQGLRYHLKSVIKLNMTRNLIYTGEIVSIGENRHHQAL
jgi:hypothetical protein